MKTSSLTSLFAFGFALSGAVAAAQPAMLPVSQAVVQALPPPAVSDLNTALRLLARNSQNLDALLQAGYASLDLGDIDAAIGFFGRAEELSPGNPRVKTGLAAAFVRSERPIEALRMFDEAERAGAATVSLASDRGLAYDLVGDHAAAQAQYASALSGPDADEIRRRLAISYAISGERGEFEQVLDPLIRGEDAAAYRTRAFGMAILGEEAEAVAIAEAVMPAAMSAQLAPYLRYMGRLTPAQQAAAANLGVFPRAAQIGRDNPRIAQYRASPEAVRSADASLAPAGEPMGARSAAPADAQAQAEPTAARGQTQRRPSRSGRLTNSERRRAEREGRRGVARETARSQPSPPAEVVQSEPQEMPVQNQLASASPPSPPPAAAVASSVELPPSQVTEAPASAVIETPPARTSQPVVQELPQFRSVSDAFSDYTLLGEARRVPANGSAVDITRIQPPREVARQEEVTPPPPPQHPSRIWVQVATGRDRSALKFDWRRISRQGADILDDFEPHVVRWGEANRLLAGPFGSAKAARDAVNGLKEAGIDTFTFTSAQGEEIEPLD